MLTYNPQLRLFLKEEVQQTSGANDGVIQAFAMNKYVDYFCPRTAVSAFETPVYYTYGGTLNYYGQDSYSIYTNIVRPKIKFIFTANTASFGSGVTIIHKVYKIDFDTFNKHCNPITEEGVNNDSNECTTTEVTKKYDNSGKLISSQTTETTTKKNCEVDGGRKTTTKAIQEQSTKTINDLITNPIVTVTGQTSGITKANYYLLLDEYYKTLGKTSYQLFEDRSQYFIDTEISFYWTGNTTYESDLYYWDNGAVSSTTYSSVIKEVTQATRHTISAGTFSGTTVAGNFFTYFIIPNKPKLEDPLVSGSLTTFSPTFYFSNVEDGDEYLLQLTYDSVVASAFTGTVYSYPITRDESKLTTQEMLNLDPNQDWAIAEESTNLIRRYSVPIKTGRDFWYRIGNVKSLTNIFGVKQSVVTFSDTLSAQTPVGFWSVYVRTKADSPYTDVVPEFDAPPYLDDSEDTFYLSGTVIGSLVTGATIQLIAPNGYSITQTTDSVGSFSFNELETGLYHMRTWYRGYKLDERSIYIDTDTTLAYKIKLIWGNQYDTWGKMASENYFL